MDRIGSMFPAWDNCDLFGVWWCQVFFGAPHNHNRRKPPQKKGVMLLYQRKQLNLFPPVEHVFDKADESIGWVPGTLQFACSYISVTVTKRVCFDVVILEK